MIHTLKQEVIGRLKAQGVSWKKFLDTPDWFEYAYYKQSGGVKRIITSLDKPPATATKTGEADMLQLAKERRTAIVRRKKRKKSKTPATPASSGKQDSIKESNIS